jgi:uncharacterized protein
MTSPHEFSIPVADLDAAGKQYRFPIRAAWVRGVLEDTEATTAGTEGVLDVRVSKSGNDVVVHGSMRAEITLPCARCLEPVTLTIAEPLSALMVPASTIRAEIGAKAPKRGKSDKSDKSDKSEKAGDKLAKTDRKKHDDDEDDDIELSGDDPDVLAYDGDTVVLDELIRDELVLEMPMIPLCSEDCPGISPPPQAIERETSPSEGPVDPRLAPLLRFKKIQETKE